MGIITILWEKWVEFRRDFYKITLAAMIAPLMYLTWRTLSELSDPGCCFTDDNEWKL